MAADRQHQRSSTDASSPQQRTKRYIFTGAFHCFCEEKQHLFRKASVINAIGRTERKESHSHMDDHGCCREGTI
eukprot:8208060-Karenia_brevis.AAC.1